MKKYVLLIFLLSFSAQAKVHQPISKGMRLFSEELSSFVSLSVNGDNADGVGSDLNGAIYLRNNINFQVATGQSRSKTNDDEGTFKYFTIGVGSDPLRLFSATLMAESTNLDDFIKSTGISIPLVVSHWDFELGLTPAVRAHIIETPNLPNIGDIGFQEDSFGLSLGYYGWDPFSIKVFGTNHTYTKEVEQFSTLISTLPALINIINGSTLSLMTSLIDRRSGIEFGYGWRDFFFALESAKTISALDQSEAITTTLYFDWDITHDWQFNSSVGGVKLPDSTDPDTEELSFTSIGVTYSWK